jgi:hypothetical protein
MDINDLLDGIMKNISQFADGRSRTSCASRHPNVRVHQIDEQRLQEKIQETGRGPENGGKNAENFEAKETNLPGRQKFGQPKAGREATGHRTWPATGA